MICALSTLQRASPSAPAKKQPSPLGAGACYGPTRGPAGRAPARCVLVRADIDKLKRQVEFNETAKEFAERVAAGEDEEELVAQTLGKDSAEELSETEAQYADAIKEKLRKRAEALKKAEEESNAVFNKGKYAYERGQYKVATKLLEEALNDAGPFTKQGGEIQLWLALSYQAEGRESDCIGVYKALEDSHPDKRIRKQAADLRFIMEAPKLEISKEEKIALPVLDLDRNVGSRGGRAVGKRAPPSKPRGPPTLEEKFMKNYQPPQWVRNKYVQTAAAILLTVLAVAGQYLK